MRSAIFMCALLAAGCGTPDQDKDGFSPVDGDCDDNDASVYPGAEEIWYDGVDQDCDGNDDDKDGDGVGLDEDCNDEDDTIEPDAAEYLGDGVDQDCSGDDAAAFVLVDLGENSSITGLSIADGLGTWVSTMAQESDDDACGSVRVTLSSTAPVEPGQPETRDVNPYRCGSGYDSVGFENALTGAFTIHWDDADLTLFGMMHWYDEEDVATWGFGWSPIYVQDFNDVAIWTDQKQLAGVGCEDDRVAYMIGTSTDYLLSGDYTNVGDIYHGGERCEVRAHEVFLLDEDGMLTVAEFNGKNDLDTVYEDDGGYNDVAATDARLVLGGSAGLTIDDGSAIQTIPTEATPSRVAVADSEGDVWIAYASTEGSAYLVWSDGSDWNEMKLSTGLSYIEDIDIHADNTSVVVAVQDGDDLAVMGVAR